MLFAPTITNDSEEIKKKNKKLIIIERIVQRQHACDLFWCGSQPHDLTFTT